MGNLQQHWRDLVPERFEGREVVQRRSFLFHFLPELLDGIVIRRVIPFLVNNNAIWWQDSWASATPRGRGRSHEQEAESGRPSHERRDRRRVSSQSGSP